MKFLKAPKNNTLSIVAVPLLILSLGIGLIELIIMQLLPWLQTLLPNWPEGLLDAVLLSLSISPLVFLIVKKDLSVTQLDSSSIKSKLLIASGLPLVIAIGLLINIISDKQQQIRTLQFTQSIVEFDSSLSRFIDLYSDEIELSMLSVIDTKKDRTALLAKRAEVDRLMPILINYLLKKGVQAGKLDRSFVDKFKENLFSMREQVDSNQVQWQDLVAFFFRSNEAFLSRLYTFSEQVTEKKIQQRHVNFLTLIKLKTINNFTRTTLSAALVQARKDVSKMNVVPLKQKIRTKTAQASVYSKMFSSTLVDADKASVQPLLASDVMIQVNAAELSMSERRIEQLVAKLSVYIGYNGFIHRFKNFVLRNRESDRLAFLALYEKVNDVISELTLLLNYDQIALQHLIEFDRVIEQYHHNLSDVAIYHQRHYDIATIDKLVKVDDSPAATALNYLENNLWEFDLAHVVDLLNEKRAIVTQIETQLKDELFKVVNGVLEDKQKDSFITATTALVLMLVVIGFLILLSRSISQAYQQRLQALKNAEIATEMKSQFLANMSHEIRTPMNGVLGMLGLVLNSSLTKEQRHRLQVAKSSADSLLVLINDILDFSKVEAGKLTLEYLDFNLHRLFGEVVESMALLAQKKDVEVILDLTQVEHLMIKSDPSRIRQILINVIGNAIKFTEHGEVVVIAKLEPASDANKLKLTCSISDTGIGISEEKRACLFDAFSQVDASTTRKYGGTGLGLSITKKLCQLMSGDIAVESTLGQGSCFVFHLEVEKSDMPQPTIPKVEISKLRVLIIDDNDTNREVLRAQLEFWGAKVEEAASGKAALALLKAKLAKHGEPQIDIALVDMQMPSMDGIELAKELKKHESYRDIKLIMMTSMGDHGEAKKYAKLGFCGYFPKPTTTEDLLSALAIVADDGESFKQAVPLVTHDYIQAAKSNKSVHRILLVEDNRVNQMVALGVLKECDLHADVASNGIEAIEMLKDTLPDNGYSLIFMDCQMPDMDGYEATRRIRKGEAGQANSTISIIAMTANAMQGDREKCLNAGMDDYLTKPIEPTQVTLMLDKWLSTEVTHELNQRAIVEREPVNENANNEKVIWDIDAFSARVNHHNKRMQMLIDCYITESQLRFNELAPALAEHQWSDLRYIFHTLSGMAANLSAVQVRQLAREMEQFVVEENYQAIVDHLAEFEQMQAELIERLNQWCRDNDG